MEHYESEGTMHETTRQMFLIKSIDRDAHLALSEWTQGWFVASGIWICDGVIEHGITEHRDTPDEAVAAFLEVLCNVPHGKSIRTGPHDAVRHWRWNGAAFAEDRFAHV